MAEKTSPVRPRLEKDSVHKDPKSRLNKQPLDSSRPWHPGEVPAGPLITISRPHGDRPYGSDWIAVEPPQSNGGARSLNVKGGPSYPRKTS